MCFHPIVEMREEKEMSRSQGETMCEIRETRERGKIRERSRSQGS